MNRQIAFNVARDDGAKTLTIDVYDVVGEYTDWWTGEEIGTSAKSVLAKTRDFVGTIVVRINSLGGSAFDGVAIYNLLRDRSRAGSTVEVHVDGIAASAASVIACAGDTVSVAANAMLMIHNAWTFAMGGADEMEKSAEMLRKLNSQIAVTYLETAQRFGKATTTEEIAAAMDAETWLTAQEALEMGLASEVTAENKAAASAIVPAIGAMPESVGASLIRKLSDAHALPEEFRRIDVAIARAVPRTVAAAHQPEPPPAQSGETNNEEQSPMSDKLIKALGANDEDEALKIAAAAAATVAAAESAINFTAAVCEATGKSGDEAVAVVSQWKANAEFAASVRELAGADGDKARAVLDSWKASHERLPSVESERDEAVAEVAARDTKAAEARKADLMKQIADAGKCTEATREQLATNSIDYLEQWLATAPVVVPGAGAKPVREPETSSAVALTSEDRKVADALGISHEDFARAKAERDGATVATTDEDDEEAPVADTNTNTEEAE